MMPKNEPDARWTFGSVRDSNLSVWLQIFAPSGQLTASIHAESPDEAQKLASRITKLLQAEDNEIAYDAKSSERYRVKQAALEERREKRRPKTTPLNRKPGIIQLNVLRALIYHKHWHAGGGWNWTTALATRKYLETLMRYGVVKLEEKTNYPGNTYWPVMPEAQQFYDRHYNRDKDPLG